MIFRLSLVFGYVYAAYLTWFLIRSAQHPSWRRSLISLAWPFFLVVVIAFVTIEIVQTRGQGYDEEDELEEDED